MGPRPHRRAIRSALAASAAELKAERYNHAAWFFGRGDLPRWAGYCFGWRIVGKYLACSAERRPSRLAGVLAAEVLSVLDHESGVFAQLHAIRNPSSPWKNAPRPAG